MVDYADDVINALMRGGIMTLRLSQSAVRGGIKLTALLKALYVKHSLQGQVPLDLLQKQGATQAFRIPKEYLEDFKAAARNINLVYAVTEDTVAGHMAIVVRAQDVGNFNHVLEGIGVAENDIEVPPNAKDAGLIKPEDVGTEYFTFSIDSERCGEFQKQVQEQSLICVSEADVKAPIEYLQPGRKGKRNLCCCGGKKSKQFSGSHGDIQCFLAATNAAIRPLGNGDRRFANL